VIFFNIIEVIPMKSEYCDIEHHTIVIDGIPLDLLLHSYHPSSHLKGLIPTIIDWIDNPKEKEFIKGRFKPTSKEFVLPVLMCPDDCDLWCTKIVANVVKVDGFITWKQIGIDKIAREELLLGYENIGINVEWFENIPIMTFEETQYYSQLSKIYD
jgi:hypothetical protein